MKDLFIKAILLVPLYFFQPGRVTGNSQSIAHQSTISSGYIYSINQDHEKLTPAKSNTPVFKNIHMDVYPADVLTGIGYIYFMNNAAGSYRKTTGYFYSHKERKKDRMKNPAKTTTMLFVIASVITLIGSAQLARKLEDVRRQT